MTCFIFLMLNITNDNKSNTEEHYSALCPAGFLRSGQDPETVFIISNPSALFFKHRSEVLRDYFFQAIIFQISGVQQKLSSSCPENVPPCRDSRQRRAGCVAWNCPLDSSVSPGGCSPVTVLLQQLKVMRDVDANIEHTLM